MPVDPLRETSTRPPEVARQIKINSQIKSLNRGAHRLLSDYKSPSQQAERRRLQAHLSSCCTITVQVVPAANK